VRRYVVRATGVQALAAYVIQTTAGIQMYDCLALCYTVMHIPCSYVFKQLKLDATVAVSDMRVGCVLERDGNVRVELCALCGQFVYNSRRKQRHVVRTDLLLTNIIFLNRTENDLEICYLGDFVHSQLV
jgi:hypothetical protein